MHTTLTSQISLPDGLITTMTPYAKALLTIIAGIVLARALSRGVTRLLGAHGPSQAALIGEKLAFWITLTLSLIFALNQIGVELSSVLAAAGIATVAISFAAQTSISNVISGIFLIIDRPFVIGDTVKVDQTLGTVAGLGLLSSKIRTFENLMVRVPNEALLKSTITNYSALAIRRVDVLVRVGYDTPIEEIQNTISALMLEHPAVLDEPEPRVLTDALGEASVSLIARAWVVREDYVQARSDLSTELVKRLIESGVTLPPPLRFSGLYDRAEPPA